jgi:hypothetical protein
MARAGWQGARTVVLPYPIINKTEAELLEIAHESFGRLLRGFGL